MNASNENRNNKISKLEDLFHKGDMSIVIPQAIKMAEEYKSVTAYNILALAHKRLGNYGLAKDIYEKLLVSNPKNRKIVIEDKVIADCLEAVIGAIYLDKGIVITERLILNLWSEHISASVITQIDAKTKLQEHSLKLFKILPVYKLVSNTGPRHKPLFKVAVKLKDTKFFTAQGTSKKDAEQNAATLCLESTLK